MAGRFTIEGVFKGSDRFSGMLGAIEAKTARFSRGMASGLRDADAAVGKLLGGLKTAALVGGTIGLGAGAGLMQVAHAGMEFEQSITNVGAVMGKNRGQIAELEKEAMRLGVVTQFSASEVSEAMESMARKGFDAAEILQGIPGVLDAIAASGEGMAEVSTVVGSTIRGFGLDAERASHVADILAFSAEKSGAKITDMGVALSTAAPTARALGVSLEDTAAAVGLLQKMGIDASTAGTATATMLAKISKPSKEAAESMAAMGVKFKDAKGDALPFRDILAQFVKVGDKAGGSMDRMAFFAELVGLRGDKAALGLAEMAKSGEFDKLTESLKNVDGYAHKVATIRLDTTKGSWKLLTSTVEVLETKLFGLKSGALRGAIDGTNQWLQANQEIIVSGLEHFLERSIPLVRDFGAGFTKGFGDTIGPLRAVTDQVMKLAGVLPGLGNAAASGERIGRLAGSLLVLSLGVKAATLAMGAFNAVTGANPYTLILAGLVALGAAFILYRPEIEAFAGKHKVLLGVIGVGVGIFVAAKIATNAWQGAILLLEITQKASAAATWLANGARAALSATTRIAAGAETLFTGQIVGTTAATEAASAGFVAAELSVGALAATLGLAAAAMASLVVAYSQWQELEQASGGHVWEGVKGIFNGKGFLGGIDEAQNDDARKRFAAEHPGAPPLGGGTGAGEPAAPPPEGGAPGEAPPPGLVAPGAGAGGVVSAAQFQQLIDALQKQQGQKLEVEVKAAPGTSAEVKPPQAGSAKPIRTTPTGGFRRPK